MRCFHRGASTMVLFLRLCNHRDTQLLICLSSHCTSLATRALAQTWILYKAAMILYILDKVNHDSWSRGGVDESCLLNRVLWEGDCEQVPLCWCHAEKVIFNLSWIVLLV